MGELIIDRYYGPTFKGMDYAALDRMYIGSEFNGWLLDFIQQRLPRHRAASATAYVASIGGVAAGLAVTHPTLLMERRTRLPKVYNEISIYVGRDFRKQGVGGELVEEVKTHLWHERKEEEGHLLLGFPVDAKSKRAFKRWHIVAHDEEKHMELTPWYPYEVLTEDYDG